MYPPYNYNAYNYPSPYTRGGAPYFIPRPYFDEYPSYEQRLLHQEKGTGGYFQEYDVRIEKIEKILYFLKILAFAQIFCGGVLLVTDISKLVLLWNFLTHTDVKLQYVSQLLYPVYITVLGFVTLSSVVSPSVTVSKFLLLLIISTVVPSIVLPRNAVFVSSAMDAMELARAAERSLYILKPRDLTIGMIQSEFAHKLMRLLAAHNERWTFGIQDISQLSPDYLLTVQYLLIAYAMFSFIHLTLLIITLIILLRLMHFQ